MEQLLLPEPFLGFADAVESLPEQLAVRFDLISSDNRMLLERSGAPLKAANELPTLLLEFEASYETISRLPGLQNVVARSRRTGEDLIAEDSWYEVRVGRPGVQARLYNSPAAPQFASRQVVDIRLLDKNEDMQLRKLHSIGQAGETDVDYIDSLLKQGSTADRFVTYRVGQGTCSALCTRFTHPQIYFDLGGGATSHLSTYPPGFCVCHRDNQPVILSHWDIDHWVTGLRDSASLDHPWLTPNQSVGPTHLKFASQLYRRGNLYVWPAALPSYHSGCVELIQCTGRSRNDSGLAAVIELQGDARTDASVLVPGDARYSHIPTTAHRFFSGLVASHHGSKHSGSPPVAQQGNRLAYTFGKGNRFGHPHAAAKNSHSGAGWNCSLDTPNGSIIVAPLAVAAPLEPPCRSSQTDACCTSSCALSVSQP